MAEPTSSPAYDTAIAEGCPESLFRGLCDWIEQPGHVVDSNDVALRYSPNTRAVALQRWRILRAIKGTLEASS